jgi:hypothetical protein
MKTGPPSVPLKMNPGAQNMKTILGALCTAENVSGSAKDKNWIRHYTVVYIHMNLVNFCLSKIVIENICIHV